MTPEQIQETIQGMLSVQRELQNSQLRQLKEIQEINRTIQECNENIRNDIRELIQNASQQQSIMSQLIGYSISTESDILTLQERMNNLEIQMRMRNNQ